MVELPLSELPAPPEVPPVLVLVSLFRDPELVPDGVVALPSLELGAVVLVLLMLFV